ncbi:MAG: dihydroneopterin aldolase [Deltaproteobacteria bacterium]|nr:MAG: dihydroneopterin aldolase [Deltaproteobacteria bacterium]
MTDRIHVQDLLLRTIIGVHDWEREARQDVRINLVLEVDLGPASRSDDLADSVDYRALTKRVIAHVEASSYGLLERLAGSIADLALAEFPKLSAITVKVDKPGALRFARSVAVEIRRERA